MIWQHAPTLEKLNDLSRDTLMQALDIVFTEVGPASLSATMPVAGPTMQPFGLLHGGASAALAETLGSTASHHCIDPATHFSVGLELNANHVRAKTAGTVVGKAEPVHLGRKTHIWAIRIVDEDEKLICISRLTTLIQQRGQPS